jgi:hypothetical protein
MSKKLPSNTKENGIVGKPAEPTLDPGGRPAAAVWVAATPVEGVVGALVEEDDEGGDDDDDGVLDEGDEPWDDASAAACEAAGATAGDDVPEALSLIERKSMWAPVDTWSSW